MMVEDHSPKFGVLWESNAACLKCHECDAEFGAINSRHHCRACGSIYCKECCKYVNVMHNSISQEVVSFLGEEEEDELRICVACLRGECPGRILKNKTKATLEASVPKNYQKIARGQSAGDDEEEEDFGEKLGLNDFKGNVKALVLTRGEISNDQAPSSKSPAASGHFEFMNKTSQCCAIKVFKSNENKNLSLIEASRPSFVSVPPGGSVNCAFDASQKEGHLDLVVLHDNPERVGAGTTRLVIETNTPGASADSISSCAAIPKFECAELYKIFVRDIGELILFHI